MYTSKTTENDLLECIKEFIQTKIYEEVASQSYGPLFRIQIDEVTDSANIEQLGITLLYLFEGKPRERLFEYIECDRTNGKELCNNIFKVFEKSFFNVKDFRSQTIDGAANMNEIKDVHFFLQQKASLAVYSYCTNHDLNLALGNCLKVPEIHVMLDSLKQLGIFFKHPPKRCRWFEDCVEQHNATLLQNKKITKENFKMFCETLWLEKILYLQTFRRCMSCLQCPESIASADGWDENIVIQALGLFNSITNSLLLTQ